MSMSKKAPACPASLSSQKLHESLRRAAVGDAVACPTCGRPVRLKLAGGKSWPGRYAAIPTHAKPSEDATT